MADPPLHEDLSVLTDQQIESKIQDLSKKYWTAYRLGKPEMLTQIQNFLTMYKSELQTRYYQKTKTELDGDLDQLINVD